MTDLNVATTRDAFLGGKLWLEQPAQGFRAGQDSLLLAASVDKRAKGRVADFGTGTGIIALALAWRCPHLNLVGIDCDAATLGLARQNSESNGLSGRLDFQQGDLTEETLVDHDSLEGVIMNPPFYQQGRERQPDDSQRARSMIGDEALLTAWVGVAIRGLKSRGWLAVIIRPDLLAVLLARLHPAMGAIQVLPLQAREGREASRLIVGAVKGRRSPLRLFPPLLYSQKGADRLWVDQVLREGADISHPDCPIQGFHPLGKP